MEKENKSIRTKLIAILFALLCLIGLVNPEPTFGLYIAYGFNFLFGQLYFIVLLYIFVLLMFLLFGLFKHKNLKTIVISLGIILFLSTILSWFFIEIEDGHYLRIIKETYFNRFSKRTNSFNDLIIKDGLKGGIIGLSIYCLLSQAITRIGCIITTIVLMAITLLIAVLLITKKIQAEKIGPTLSESLEVPPVEIKHDAPKAFSFEYENLVKPATAANYRNVFLDVNTMDDVTIQPTESNLNNNFIQQNISVPQPIQATPKINTFDQNKLNSNYKKFNVFTDEVYSAEDQVLDAINGVNSASKKFSCFNDDINNFSNQQNCVDNSISNPFVNEVQDLTDSPFMVEKENLGSVEIKEEPKEQEPYLENNIHNSDYQKESISNDFTLESESCSYQDPNDPYIDDVEQEEYLYQEELNKSIDLQKQKEEERPIPTPTIQARNIDPFDDKIFIYSQRLYKLPSRNLLADNPKKIEGDFSQNNINAQTKSILLNAKLASLGVDGKVVGYKVAPSFTRFEIQVAPNVKISSIPSIQKDLMMALEAPKVNVLAPIPGTGYVGVEIPNAERTLVTFKECLLEEPFDKKDNKLLVNVGRDIDNKVVSISLDRCPHLLVAGSTGTGKSVFLNSLIMSILMRAYPNEVGILLIDPKKVEFTPYAKVPHLICPIVTDIQEAIVSLKKLCEEMDKRYKLLQTVGKRDIQGYNRLMESLNKPKMPYIVCVIDELADLILQAKTEVENSIVRLAGLARGCGIHLVIATQRPSVNIVTGVIKANIQSSIALAVRDNVNSRVILDEGGAEELLGKGDMIVKMSGLLNNMRVQGCNITDEEIDAVTSYLASVSTQEFNPLFECLIDEDELDQDEVNEDLGLKVDKDEELLSKIIEFCMNNEKVSISHLRAKFRIAHCTAFRMMEKLQELNIVGPVEGNSARTINKQALDNYINSQK